MSPDVPGLAQQIAYFEDRLRLDPQSRAFVALADLYRRTERPVLARDLLREGLQHHPGFVSARVTLALVLADLGEVVQARQEMDAVLADDADNLSALRFLVTDAERQQQWERATPHAERLIRLAPDDRQARRVLQRSRNPEVAPAPPLEAAAPGDPTGFVTPTLAELYLRQGHLEKARLICQRILAMEPDREDARSLLERVESQEQAAAPARPPVEAQANGRPRRGAAAPQGSEIDRFRSWLDAASGDRRDSAN